MPPYVPFPLAAVYVSGVFEILFAIGILIPATREWSGNLLILLTLAVTPANVHMWLHPELFPDVSADVAVDSSRRAGAAAGADLVEHANASSHQLGRARRRLIGTCGHASCSAIRTQAPARTLVPKRKFQCM